VRPNEMEHMVNIPDKNEELGFLRKRDQGKK
jgi:hypothetical protein